MEVKDDTFDLVDLKSHKYVNSTDHLIDILSVDYISDGKFLNATLWTKDPFKNETTKSIKYGMLIDSDFDKETGVEGINNQVEIQWNNITKKWTLLVSDWSSNEGKKILYTKDNYTNFFTKGNRYVDISLDLALLHYPNKYKVTFYAEADHKTRNITDYTKMIAIPPLDLNLTTSPTTLTLSPEESKTIEVKISSSKGYEPAVFLNATSLSGNIKMKFKEGYESIRVPSFGIVTVPLFISVKNASIISPDTLLITANSSFPSEEIISTQSSKGVNSKTLESDRYKSNNFTKQITMAIEVIPSLSLIQKFGDVWNNLGPSITFLMGIMVDRVAPLIVNYAKQKNLSSKVKNKFSNKKRKI